MRNKIKEQAKQLIPRIAAIHTRAIALEHTFRAELEAMDSNHQSSARNLLHYLALRQVDMRQLQQDLAAIGLSSLGRAESHALSALNKVGIALYRLAQLPVPDALLTEMQVNATTGPMLLNNCSDTLLGIAAGKRTVRIMVTMSSEAATNPALICDLLEAGMDVMRINCAHDGPQAWEAMIANLRTAERHLGRSCKVHADLAGPKLRTGAIPPLTHLVKARPQRNLRGQVLQPASVRFVAKAVAPNTTNGPLAVPVPDKMIQRAQIDDVLEMKDARGKWRRFTITEMQEDACVAATEQTAYIETGSRVNLKRGKHILAKGEVGLLPELIEPILLQVGDTLIVTKEDSPGAPAQRDDAGNVTQPAQIPCTLPEVFAAVEVGQAIWFDDGKIGGSVVANDGERITVSITFTGGAVAKLAPEKGINLPDTTIKVSALTAKDLIDLAFMVEWADIIGLSFVRTPADVQQLERELDRLNAKQKSIVLKIETGQAFDNLPRLLLSCLHLSSVGIMVARGDLAVEVGFERMAEVQEEILWLCEAAHMPVIWATQVLESMAQRGAPSRAEVSDAAMSERAECVMLNKGPFIVETVRFLSGVLERMTAHQSKKSSMLRRLAVSQID